MIARLENKSLNMLGGHPSISVGCGRPMAFLELDHNLLREMVQKQKTEALASEA